MTLILNPHVVPLPLLSTASQTTSVMPIGNSDPDAGVQEITKSASDWSITVGLSHVNSAVAFPGSVDAVMLNGQFKISRDGLSEIQIFKNQQILDVIYRYIKSVFEEMTNINIRKLVFVLSPLCFGGVKVQEYQLDYEKAFDFVEHVDLKH